MIVRWIRSDGKTVIYTNIIKVCVTKEKVFAIKKGEEDTSIALDLTDIEFEIVEG